VTDDHPDAAALESYARGELGREPRRALERHLAGCADCQAAVDRIPVPPAGGGVVRWQGHRFAARRAANEREEARREVLGGVLSALGTVIANVSRGELDELLAADEHRRRALIRDELRFRSLPVCELLQARCRSLWLADPDAAVESAKLAVLIAERVTADGGGEKAEDARAMSLMHLGSAFRIAAEERRQMRPQIADDADAGGRSAAGGMISEPAPSWESELALWELRDAFLGRGMGFDAVLVCLELAAELLREGRQDELRRMVEESIPLFEQHAADPFAIDALRFLHDEKRREGRPLTLDLVEKMARYLAEARHDPRHVKGLF